MSKENKDEIADLKYQLASLKAEAEPEKSKEEIRAQWEARKALRDKERADAIAWIYEHWREYQKGCKANRSLKGFYRFMDKLIEDYEIEHIFEANLGHLRPMIKAYALKEQIECIEHYAEIFLGDGDQFNMKCYIAEMLKAIADHIGKGKDAEAKEALIYIADNYLIL